MQSVKKKKKKKKDSNSVIQDKHTCNIISKQGEEAPDHEYSYRSEFSIRWRLEK